MAALTNSVLESNGFTLNEDTLNWEKTYNPGEEEVLIEFDSHFYIIIDEDIAYPKVSTIEEANDRFDVLGIDFRLT